MRKKPLYIGSAISVLAIAFLVWFILSNGTNKPSDINSAPSQNASDTINVVANGTFVYQNGTTDPVSIYIFGTIDDTPDDLDDLDVTIDFPETFPYRFSSSINSSSSIIEKHNDLPHLLICGSYAYNKWTNSSEQIWFAFDLEENCYIFLFKNRRDCYLVASQDTCQTHEQLVEHFADFIEAYGPHIWKDK